jgi:hypothetical protein
MEEFISLLAAICANGIAIPAALIYNSSGRIFSYVSDYCEPAFLHNQ